MKLKKFAIWLPVVLFAGLVWVLWQGLMSPKTHNTAPQLDKPAPVFHLADLFDNNSIDNDIFIGQVSLVNFWASWCAACHDEHAMLLQIATQYGVPIIGVNYKDENADAKAWLSRFGNPYQYVISDIKGDMGMDWGVIAVPETFIVDELGIIRYKQSGPINSTLWEETLWPRIMMLQKESD